jgi:lambda repressor-like predicted transcriptional regulator
MPSQGRRKDWARIVASYRRSGLTQQAFADRQGIPVETLRSWIYRRAAKAAPRLLAVRVAGAESGTVEVRMPSGITVRVAGSVDAAYVAALVRALA